MKPSFLFVPAVFVLLSGCYHNQGEYFSINGTEFEVDEKSFRFVALKLGDPALSWGHVTLVARRDYGRVALNEEATSSTGVSLPVNTEVSLSRLSTATLKVEDYLDFCNTRGGGQYDVDFQVSTGSVRPSFNNQPGC